MGDAKDIVVKPISKDRADQKIKNLHYSGKVVPNSQLHLGVFYNHALEGAMQFGPSMDKRKIQGLVSGTGWNEFMELNRMAFSDELPPNSESRALSIAFKLFDEHAPHVKWVVSFADAAQCGDGTIYRASNFVLTGIKKNTQMYRFPDGETLSRKSLTNVGYDIRRKMARKYNADISDGSASIKPFEEIGAEPINGYQLRYIYFIDKSYRDKLNVEEIPYSKIDEIGAGMYKGEKISYKKRNQPNPET